MPVNQPVTPGSTEQTLRPASLWTAANLLTLFRIALIAPFVLMILKAKFTLALAIFFIASVTDFADGYIARRFNQRSSVGRFLDPLADKMLTTAAFVVMAVPREGFPSIPIWLVVAVIARDFFIVIAAAIIYLMTGFKRFTPTLAGKVNTFMEMGLIVFFLAAHSAGLWIFLLPYAYLLVLASVVVSAASYINRGIRIFLERKPPPLVSGSESLKK